MTFLTILGVSEICSLRLLLQGKTSQEIADSSRLKVFEKFQETALSDAEDNNSGLLNRGGVAGLPLSRTLLVIYQKS